MTTYADGDDRESKSWQPQPELDGSNIGFLGALWKLTQLRLLQRRKFPQYKGGVARPWRAGHTLTMEVQGDYISEDEHRLQVMYDGYSSTVGGDRVMMVKNNYESVLDSATLSMLDDDVLVVGGKSKFRGGLDEGVNFMGNAKPANLTKMMTDTGDLSMAYKRSLKGTVIRIAATDGIICGGFACRTHLGPVMTTSLFSTSDVYASGIKTAAVRTLVAKLNYRSTEMALWLQGLSIVKVKSVVEPDIEHGAAMKRKPRNKSGLWNRVKQGWRYAQYIVGWIGAFFPLADILMGVVSFLVGIPGMLIGLGHGFMAGIRKLTGTQRGGEKKDKGAPGPPRTRIVYVGGVEQNNKASETVM